MTLGALGFYTKIRFRIQGTKSHAGYMVDRYGYGTDPGIRTHHVRREQYPLMGFAGLTGLEGMLVMQTDDMESFKERLHGLGIPTTDVRADGSLLLEDLDGHLCSVIPQAQYAGLSGNSAPLVAHPM